MSRRPWLHIQFYRTSAFPAVHAGTVRTQLPEAGPGYDEMVGKGANLDLIATRARIMDGAA